MGKAFIVTIASGYYEDYRERILGIFTTRPLAERCKLVAERELLRYRMRRCPARIADIEKYDSGEYDAEWMESKEFKSINKFYDVVNNLNNISGDITITEYTTDMTLVSIKRYLGA